MDTIKGMLDNLGGLLRYFMPALVGVVFAWLLAPKEVGFLTKIVTLKLGDHESSDVVSWIPLLLFTVAAGVVIYTIHHNILYAAIEWFIHRVILKETNKTGTTDDWIGRLALARWNRRYGDEKSQARRVQEALNTMNHRGHFLYCSSYAIVLIPLILYTAFGVTFPEGSGSWVAFIAFLLWFFAFLSDIRTTEWDAAAMKTFSTAQTGDDLKTITPGCQWRRRAPLCCYLIGILIAVVLLVIALA